MKDLLKEAIAEAKAVRETAMANAKLALEEAFTPRIQSMLAAKLSEEMEDEEMKEEDEMAIDAEETGMEVAPEPESMEEADYEGDKVEEGDEEDPMAHGNIGEEEMEEADLDLEAIIRELEEAEGEEEEMKTENVDSSDIGKGENTKPSKEASDATTQDPQGSDLFEELSLDEIVAALREEDGEEEAEPKKMEEAEEAETKEKELEEAYNVIRFLRSKINEVNLLNAKLLFSNKLFRNNELSESQKMKVIENFDRATTMREVKLVYATIAESLNSRKAKSVVKESKGTASAPQKSTAPSKAVLNEGNDLAARWKKLANLK
jgi:hypothetical protein